MYVQPRVAPARRLRRPADASERNATVGAGPADRAPRPGDRRCEGRTAPRSACESDRMNADSARSVDSDRAERGSVAIDLVARLRASGGRTMQPPPANKITRTGDVARQICPLRPVPGPNRQGTGSARGSERPQEVQDVLLDQRSRQIEVVDDLVGFRAAALVVLDRGQQVVGPSVMEEEDALADTPERGAAELLAIGTALGDLILKPGSHIVQRYVAEREIGHEALIAVVRLAGDMERQMAESAADIEEGCISELREQVGRTRRRRGGEAHEQGEVGDV